MNQNGDAALHLTHSVLLLPLQNERAVPAAMQDCIFVISHDVNHLYAGEYSEKLGKVQVGKYC